MSNPYTHPDPVAPVSTTAVDPIVEAVREKLHQRSQLGIRKYGTPLGKPTVTTLEWLNHAQQEALDLANYLEVLIQIESKKHSR